MSVEIRHLRQFLAVAEELHFSRAADRLHLAQPALSANIRKLESSLQLRLFVRSTRNVELTNEGSLFAEEATLAVDAYDRAIVAAERLRRGGSGPMTLGVYSAVSADIKRAIVTHLRELNPDVELTIVAEGSSRLVESLIEGRIDAALCVAPVGTGDLRRVLLTHEPMVAAVPANHRLAERSSIQLVDLKEDAWILPSRRTFRENSALHRLCAQAGFIPCASEAVSDFDDDFTAVRSGAGVQVVPAGFISAPPAEEVRIVPIEHAEVPIYLLARSSETSPAFPSLARAVVAAAGSPSRMDASGVGGGG